MRIAVFYNLPPGGAKRTLFEQVKYLSNKHYLDVFTPKAFRKDQFPIEEYAQNTKIFSYPESKFTVLRSLFSDFVDGLILPYIHKKIAIQIDSGNYDVVLVHQDINTQAPYLLRYLKTPSVYFCQEYLRIGYEKNLGIEKSIKGTNFLYEKVRRAWRKRIDFKNARAATQIITNSKFSQKNLSRAYQKPVKKAYLGVDGDMFKPSKKLKKNYFVFVGSKTKHKGYPLLTAALKLIPYNIRPVVKVLNAYTTKSVTNDVTLAQIYSQALATICPSPKEPFGLSAIESMACGTPVIAVNEGGFTETVINGKTGLLVERTEKSLAAVILKFVKNPNLSFSYFDSCVKRAGEFSWNLHNQVIEKILFQNALRSNILISGQDSGGWGGSEKFLLSLASNLQDSQRELLFSTVSKSKFTKKIKETGIYNPITIAFRMDILGGIKGLLKFFALLAPALIINFSILFKFKKDGGKIVLIPSFSDKIILTPLSKLLKLKTIWIEYAPLTPLFKRNLGLGMLAYRAVSGLCDQVVVPTENTRKHIQKLKLFPISKIKLIPIGVDRLTTAQIKKAQINGKKLRNKMGLGGKIVVGMVSRIEKEKGQDTLIRAVKLLEKKIPNLVCLIVGEGDDKYLRNIITKENIKNIKLLGYLKEVGGIISSFNIFAFPSRWGLEGFGIAPLEAMELGIPVIASNMGPVPEVVGDAALITRPTPEDIAKAIEKLVENLEVKNKLIKKGKLRVRDFDIKEISRKYKNLIDTTLY